MMKRAMRMLIEEFEKDLSPWIVRKLEQFVPQCFQFIGADRPDGFRNRFPPFFTDTFKVDLIEWHRQ
jgi:hypothetical protein